MNRRKIILHDEDEIKRRLKKANFDTFYHYFPLILAISESTSPLYLSQDGCQDIFVGEDSKEVYIPDVGFEPLEGLDISKDGIEKIWIMPRKPENDTIEYKLYDVNYIYDLCITTRIKNFRKNARRFMNEFSPRYECANPEKALEVVKNWYLSRKKGEYSDFGYTIWLAKNYDLFTDLRARIVSIDGEPVAFTLWGILSEEMAIHLVCKDLGKPRYPFAIDYARLMTYKEMMTDGFKLVNDGSDCGYEGIRFYKQKLRPIQILPIYSWVIK